MGERGRGSERSGRHDLIVEENEFHLLSHSKFIAFVRQEWVREKKQFIIVWLVICMCARMSGNPLQCNLVAMTQISSQTCAHWQACTDPHRHGSLPLNCPLQGNAGKKETNLCGSENRETFALETFWMSLSQGGQQRPCRAALCWIRLGTEEHPSHQSGSDQSPGWGNLLWHQKTLDKSQNPH